MPCFEWDGNKRSEIIETRGLEFFEATRLTDIGDIVTAPIAFDIEARFVSIARRKHGKADTVVWTWRHGERRTLSFRRATNGEERAYRL